MRLVRIRRKDRYYLKQYTLLFLCSAALILILSMFWHGIYALTKNITASTYKKALGNTMPQMTVNMPREGATLNEMLCRVIGFDINNPGSVLQNQIIMLGYAQNLDESDVEQESIPAASMYSSAVGEGGEGTAPLLSLSLHPADDTDGYSNSQGVTLRNSTTHDIDVGSLLASKLNFNMSGNLPKVLILHSHASEAFMPTDTNFYKPSDPDRTEDINFNVVRVGAEMAKTLNQMGISTLHDQTLHDYPSYNGSYKASLATVEKYLEKYPSIEIVIDVHRDALQRGESRLKPVTVIDGQKMAQVMIVCGSEQGGLEHPNWRENLTFACAYQKSMDDLYPTLTRPIDFRKERFNMHTTAGSLILEVGSNGNTLEEAIAGARAAAQALATLLNNL